MREVNPFGHPFAILARYPLRHTLANARKIIVDLTLIPEMEGTMFKRVFTIFLLSASMASGDTIVLCDEGRWEGYRVGHRGGSDGENGISYPTVAMIFEKNTGFGDLASVSFGGNLFHEHGTTTTGLVTHRTFAEQPLSQKSYLIIHTQPQQIPEVFTVDLETGDVIMSQTIGDRHGISVDTFKKRCTIKAIETYNADTSSNESPSARLASPSNQSVGTFTADEILELGFSLPADEGSPAIPSTRRPNHGTVAREQPEKELSDALKELLRLGFVPVE